MDLDNLQYVALKGQGYFCTVKKYKDEQTKHNYALKELKKDHYSNDEYRYRLLREIKLLSELEGCPNIIPIINNGNDTDNQNLWYLMPFAECNLHEYIRKNNGKIESNERYEIVRQIINAIKHAHEKNILHRDLSPNNILIFLKDGELTVKVSDFGLGKNTESLSYYTGSSASGYGQILYVSPEQKIQLKEATNKSDIYSLGKLVYFIFTGRDPDNIKPFELGSLVTKSIEDNPADRFTDIYEFESHFESLRTLQLEQEIPIEHLTLHEIIESEDDIPLMKIHELFIRGNYTNHVYYDYIEPVNKYLLTRDNLEKYYRSIGGGILDFIKTYTDRLNECYKSTRWPFSSMSGFGAVLKKIIQLVPDEEVRLLCFKQLWYLAFEVDQWSVQKDINEVFDKKYISKNIETQLAEYIINSETKVDLDRFSELHIPKVVKIGIIQGNTKIKEKETQRDNVALF